MVASGDPNGAPNGGSSGTANENDSGGTNFDGSVLGDGATAQCTPIALTGVVVDEQGTDGNVPNGNGGTIADGTYNLTQVARYVGATGGIGVGPTGNTYQETIQITNGTTFERVRVVASNATTGTEARYAGVMVATSPNVSVTFSCPLQTTEQYSYTATGSSLVLISGAGAATGEQYTYTRQL